MPLIPQKYVLDGHGEMQCEKGPTVVAVSVYKMNFLMGDDGDNDSQC